MEPWYWCGYRGMCPITKFVRTFIFLIVFSAAFGPLKAQDPAPQSQEGQFLELIDLESDPPKQLALMDLFIKQFPNYNAMAALYADMQADYIKVSLWDKALEIGGKLLQIDQDDIDAVRMNLEAAKGKNDDSLIKRWTERLGQLSQEPNGTVSASSTTNTPYVEGVGMAGDGPKDPKAQAAKTVRARQEAALFNKALQEADPSVRIEILNQYLQQYPQSIHINKVNYLYYLAYREMKDEKRAMAMAEQILTKDQTREDVLYYVAESLFKQKRDLAKVIVYSQEILDLVKRPKPEGRQDDEWNRQVSILTSQAHWMIGMSEIYREQFASANQELRAALAGGSSSDSMRPALLTNLAWANYKLKNIPDAIKFYQECAAIPSAYQKAAADSVKGIKSEYGLVQ
jgi:tetratricopeptide (TPR) repeat protein